MTLSIPFINDHLLVCEKPEGVLSVPPKREGVAPDLPTLLAAQVGPVRVVHRLDMETSGLLVFARTLAAQRDLIRQFRERKTHKRYRALCPPGIEDAGKISYPLSPDYIQRPRQQVDWFYGKDADTRWRVVGRSGSYTRLDLFPITGRTHQLRLHLAAYGYPLLGDGLYASPELQAVSPRLCLHAAELGFTLLDGTPVTIRSPEPF